jgi:hypothetical protein
MAEKNWVDLDDFIECYLLACVFNRVKFKGIGVAIRKARNRRQESDRYEAWEREHYPLEPGKQFKIINLKDLTDVTKNIRLGAASR